MSESNKPSKVAYFVLGAFTAAALTAAVYFNREVKEGVGTALHAVNEHKPDCVKAIDERITELYKMVTGAEAEKSE